jgi:hypothetical protein
VSAWLAILTSKRIPQLEVIEHDVQYVNNLIEQRVK